MIAPSLLSADFSNLQKAVSYFEDTEAKWLHLDIMDGHFVPNLTFGPGLVKKLRPYTQLLFDCHLMVENPEQYVDDFIDAGADMITVHVETTAHLQRLLTMIKEKGCMTGAVLNPATPLSSLEWILDDVDMILLMSVNPGFGGQKFIPNSLDKLKALKNMIGDREILIQIDGGVTLENARLLKDAGADILVAGSSVYGKEDPRQAFLDLMEEVR